MGIRGSVTILGPERLLAVGLVLCTRKTPAMALALLLAFLPGCVHMAAHSGAENFLGPSVGQTYVYAQQNGLSTTMSAISEDNGVIFLRETICCLRAHYGTVHGLDDFPDTVRSTSTLRAENNQLIQKDQNGNRQEILLDLDNPVWSYPLATVHRVPTDPAAQKDASAETTPGTWQRGVVNCVCRITADRQKNIWGAIRRVIDVACKVTGEGTAGESHTHTLASGIGIIKYSTSPSNSKNTLRLVEIRED